MVTECRGKSLRSFLEAEMKVNNDFKCSKNFTPRKTELLLDPECPLSGESYFVDINNTFLFGDKIEELGEIPTNSIPNSPIKNTSIEHKGNQFDEFIKSSEQSQDLNINNDRLSQEKFPYDDDLATSMNASVPSKIKPTVIYPDRNLSRFEAISTVIHADEYPMNDDFHAHALNHSIFTTDTVYKSNYESVSARYSNLVQEYQEFKTSYQELQDENMKLKTEIQHLKDVHMAVDNNNKLERSTWRGRAEFAEKELQNEKILNQIKSKDFDQMRRNLESQVILSHTYK